MKTRRQFVHRMMGFLIAIGTFFTPFSSFIHSAYARTKRVLLDKNTKRSSLTHKNPRTLDTSQLEITPLSDFETMGMTNHPVAPGNWRLQVSGAVASAIQLTYSEILSFPVIEKNVLLICPGIFVNHGRWKGISIQALLDMAKIKPGASHITITGPLGSYKKTEKFTLAEVHSNKVFLAYGVNGKQLPQKHGFPLRVVAEDHYGNDWVKFVEKITVYEA